MDGIAANGRQTLDRLGRLWLTEVDLGDFQVRGVLIPGEERVVVWDTLSHPEDMQVLRPILGDRQLVIAYSHADWDHVWGTAGLPAASTVIGHELCRKRFATELVQTLAEKRALEGTRWQAVQLVPPSTTFTREYTLSLGSTALSLHHLPGHTPDSIVGFLPDDGVLLAGDAVETPFPLVPAACDLARWIEELRGWQEDPRLKTVIPAHGAIGGPEILSRNITYLRQLLAGGSITVPERLSEFYRHTHLANLRAWRRARR